MSAANRAYPRILHVHSHFPEGAGARRSRVIAAGLEGAIEHRLVVVEGDAAAASSPFRPLQGFPRLTGRPTLGRLQRIARAMLGFDLVCSYDYGAMNAVMAHTAFSRAFDLPPLVHHEGEGAERSRKADWYRRIALGKAAGLVVPDEELERTALVDWQQPFGRVKLIPEGIDLDSWTKRPPRDFHPGLLKRRGEKWIGAVTNFGGPGRLANLLHAVAPIEDQWHLVLLGESSRDAKANLRAQAEALDMAHRLHLAGTPAADERSIGLFDIALVLPDMPDGASTAMRAMAASVPVLAEPGSHAALLLPDGSDTFIVSLGDVAAVRRALDTLTANPEERRAAGKANREQAEQRHDAKQMIAAHRRLYASAMKRPSLL